MVAKRTFARSSMTDTCPRCSWLACARDWINNGPPGVPRRVVMCRAVDTSVRVCERCRVRVCVRACVRARASDAVTWRFRAENERNDQMKTDERARRHARTRPTGRPHAQVLWRNNRRSPPCSQWKWGTCCSWPSHDLPSSHRSRARRFVPHHSARLPPPPPLLPRCSTCLFVYSCPVWRNVATEATLRYACFHNSHNSNLEIRTVANDYCKNF